MIRVKNHGYWNGNQNLITIFQWFKFFFKVFFFLALMTEFKLLDYDYGLDRLTKNHGCWDGDQNSITIF
jgi:hypothetical protein